MKAIETHGLFNLNDFPPKKPSEVEVKVMKEMFESVLMVKHMTLKDLDNTPPAGMAARTGDPWTE